MRWALVACVLLAGPGALAAPTSTAYTGFLPFVLFDEAHLAPLLCSQGVGGACFQVPASTHQVSVAVHDASGLPVWAELRTDDDAVLLDSVFCGSAADVPVVLQFPHPQPIPVRVLLIAPDVRLVLEHPECSLAGLGTTGTITLDAS
jgi:hypothetical protein